MNNRFWTFRYSLINITYYAGFCTMHAYAAVYLLSHGFSNTEVGLLLALANILSAILQPFIAGIIDKPGPLTNRRYILISVAIIALCSLLLMILPSSKPVVFALYALLYTVQFVYQPVVTALNFEYEKAGCSIYYGLARGLGSAGFAVTSAFIGGIVERDGADVLLIANLVIMALSAIAAFTFIKPGGDTKETEVSEEKDLVAHNNLFDFARTYPAFMLFLLGTVCFFFAHNMINDFLIQIIRSLGGAETELGYATFLAAILELPVMAVIGVILKKISADRLMVFSGAAFLVKTLILVFATQLAAMFVSQAFQMFAYAVFVPASAYYVSATMEELDQVKGQAYVSSAITVGGVFSNLICGSILDNLGVRPMLVTGSAVCAVGVAIAFAALIMQSRRTTYFQ